MIFLIQLIGFILNYKILVRNNYRNCWDLFINIKIASEYLSRGPNDLSKKKS